jgi:membrane-bound lytic murein transglycosylase B
MSGVRTADGSDVHRRRRARRHVASALAVASLATATAAGSAGATAAEGDGWTSTTTSSTAPGSPTTTSTALLPGATPTSTSSTSTSTTAVEPTTSTTSAADAAREWRTIVEGDAGTPLPPASPGVLPPEEDVPPPPDAPPPVPPPGSNEAGQARARLELRATEAALKKAKVDELKAAKRLIPFGQRLSEAKAALAALRSEDREVARQLTEAKAKVRRIAVAGYVRGGDTQPVDFLLRAADPIDLERRRTIVETATEARRDAVDDLAAAQRGSSQQLRSAVAAAEQAQSAYDAVEGELRSASAVAALLTMAAEEKRQLLDLAGATALVAGTDLPRLVLDAYQQAAATMARRAPNCRVRWTAIAGIGKVESNHGRYRGAQLTLNGDVYPRILGIPLDGTRSALITDTDGGLLDGDVVYDRAVGPMQFIPSTWTRINEDGNRDGVRDPNNLYDAALGTAAYLCRAVPTGGLDTDEGLRPAIFSYNHSDAYVDLVLSWSHTYAGDPPPVPTTAPAPAAPAAPAP